MAENSEPFDSFLISSYHRKLSFYCGKRNHSSSYDYDYVCIRIPTLGVVYKHNHNHGIIMVFMRVATLMNTIITTPSLNFELPQFIKLVKCLI